MTKIISKKIQTAILKKKLEASFPDFVTVIFESIYGIEFLWSEHHHLIVDFLMRVHQGDVTHAIINVPPRYGKTELIIKLFNAWTFAKNPMCRSLHLSYSNQLALSNSSAIRDIINSSVYQMLWPNVNVKVDTKSKARWATSAGGEFYATSAGGAVTGFGAGNIVEFSDNRYTYHGGIYIDDPLKPIDSNSDRKREAVNNNWDQTIKSRRNSRHTPVIVVMQRLHELDFVGKLLQDSEFDWEHLVLSGIVDEGLETERALWPEKHSLGELKAQKAKNALVFSAQYQQNPTPPDGGLLQRCWFKFYESQAEIIKKCNFFYITADTAYTDRKWNDPSVLQLWGAESGDRLNLISQLSGWWEFPELLKNSVEFFEHARSMGRNIGNFWIEDKASGKSLVQQLKKMGVPSKAWVPKKFQYPDDKVGRVKNSSWSIINGDIQIPPIDEFNWVEGFLTECERFTDNDSHAHDDQIDAMTMAISVWNKMGGGTTYEQAMQPIRDK